MSHRLLFAPGGSFRKLHPPFDDSWVRSDANPFFNGLAEPCVLYEAGVFRMWARGSQLHYATSTDGENFTGGDPIFGGGEGGYANNVWLPWITRIDGIYYLSFVTDDFSETYAQATSPDGLVWTPTSPTISLPPGCDLWGNKVVWKEGSTWYMLHEAAPTAQFWRIYLYSSSDGLTWSIQNGGAVVNGLQIAANGMYGGPRFAYVDGELRPKLADGLYHLWFHAADVAGNLPTDIYHATSSDRINWTVSPAGPVLEHLGTGTFEFDQVADACPVVVGSRAFLYYDGVDNTGPIDTWLAVATAGAIPF